MPVGRRVERSRRLTLAGGALCLSGLLVLVAAVEDRLLLPAACLAVAAGAVALLVGRSETARLRRSFAAERAALARSAAAAAGRSAVLQRAELARQERRVRVAERAVAALQNRTAESDRRLAAALEGRRQADARATEAQRRLADVLDEVFGTEVLDEEPAAAA